MAKILCWLGLHKWRLWKKETAYEDERYEVKKVFVYCERCRKDWQYYDTGE